jgi:hypothetical protein
MNTFVRMMHAEHPDFADSGSVVDMPRKEDDADAGNCASSAEQQSAVKKKQGEKIGGSFHNNLVKFACCVPMHLRFVLQDALPKFSQQLFAQMKKTPSCEEGTQHDYTAIFGELYSIFFGSMFYLDIMEARNHLKSDPPRVKDYVCACLDIGFDVDSNKIESKRLVLPWQDVVLSVKASRYLSPDAQPSQANWTDILGDFLKDKESDSQQILANLLSEDVRVLGEKWALLDSAYESPARGFFDFECNSKLVFESALQEMSPLLVTDSFHFEDWWNALTSFRCCRDNKRQGVLRDLKRFEPADAPARSTFWDHSAQALWLLDFITFGRIIMFEEYEKPREMAIVGSKRPAHSKDSPTKTFRDFFDFASSEILNYDIPAKKQMVMIKGGTADAKIFSKFSEWLEHHNQFKK